jgi:hypothetical protein
MQKIDTIILVPRKGMGQGPEDLQLMLLEKYLKLLDQSESLPAAMCFYTEGVHLLTDSSPLLPQFSFLGRERCSPDSLFHLFELLSIDGKIKSRHRR